MHIWQVNIQNLIKYDRAENDDHEVDRAENDRITRIIRDQFSDGELINDEVIDFDDETIERLLNMGQMRDF